MLFVSSAAMSCKNQCSSTQISKRIFYLESLTLQMKKSTQQRLMQTPYNSLRQRRRKSPRKRLKSSLLKISKRLLRIVDSQMLEDFSLNMRKKDRKFNSLSLILSTILAQSSLLQPTLISHLSRKLSKSLSKSMDQAGQTLQSTLNGVKITKRCYRNKRFLMNSSRSSH